MYLEIASEESVRVPICAGPGQEPRAGIAPRPLAHDFLDLNV
jgi:hypothetical protein